MNKVYKTTCIIILVSAVFAAGCSSPKPILGCEYFGTHNNENINEIRNDMNISSVVSLSNYSELSEENKRVFKKALRDETDVSKEIDRARYHNNTTFLNRSQMDGFFSVSGEVYATRYIIYSDNIYDCGYTGNKGVA